MCKLQKHAHQLTETIFTIVKFIQGSTLLGPYTNVPRTFYFLKVGSMYSVATVSGVRPSNYLSRLPLCSTIQKQVSQPAGHTELGICNMMSVVYLIFS